VNKITRSNLFLNLSIYFTRITNDAREEEMENNVGEVNSMISNLRNMAIDMGNEIGGQNRQIGRINHKVRISIGYNIWDVVVIIWFKYKFSRGYKMRHIMEI
jgi:hypothetical protein